MKLREDHTCPLELTHDLIRGKWKPIILWKLEHASASLSELKKSINGISEKMLLQHLQELQDFDIVTKYTYDGYPLRVEYQLTERGWKMVKVITQMQKVGIELMLEDGKEELLCEKGLI